MRFTSTTETTLDVSILTCRSVATNHQTVNTSRDLCDREHHVTQPTVTQQHSRRRDGGALLSSVSSLSLLLVVGTVNLTLFPSSPARGAGVATWTRPTNNQNRYLYNIPHRASTMFFFSNRLILSGELLVRAQHTANCKQSTYRSKQTILST